MTIEGKDMMSKPESWKRRDAAFKRRWDRLLRDLHDEMKARGAKDPQFYFEGENGLYVTDGDVWSGGPHPERTNAEQEPEAINLKWPHDIRADTGGW